MRILIVGDGAVARIHGEGLSDADPPHDVRFWAPAVSASSFDASLAVADAVIVASPTSFHYEQALSALGAGKHVLVELPPVASEQEAATLAEAAAANSVTLGCCHTSRYLAPYRSAGRILANGSLGAVRDVTYTRHIAPKHRAWQDHAIRHHAAHALDLLLDWFGDVHIDGASGSWHGGLIRATLPNGGTVSISVLYDARHPAAEMRITCDHGLLATDGYSWLRSGSDDWSWDASDVYPAAIAEQDNAFFALNSGYVPWTTTTALIRLLDQSESLMNS